MTADRWGKRNRAWRSAIATAALIAVLGALAVPAGAASTTADTSVLPQDEASVDAAVTQQIDDSGSAPVIVRFDTDTQAQAAAASPAVEGSVLDSAAPIVVATVDAEGLTELREAPGAATVTSDREHTVSLSDSTTSIGADIAWNDLGTTGAGYRIAILDTGVLATHPFLGGRVTSEACFSGDPSDWWTSGFCPGSDPHLAFGAGAARPCSSSVCRHGTHVTGIAAGSGGPASAPSGVAPGADILAVQVFSKSTGGNVIARDSDLIEAMQWVADQQNETEPIVALNMSLGGAPSSGYCDTRSGDDLLKSQIDALADVGIAVVAASGNDSTSDGDKAHVDSPGCISTAITVGATDDNREVQLWSMSASPLDIVAPGASISSSSFTTSSSTGQLTPGYEGMSGTSMATPHVTATLALVAQARGPIPVAAAVESLTRYAPQTTDPANQLARPFLRADSAVTVNLSPLGSLESVSTGAGSFELSGWAIDPDTIDQITLEVRVGGVPVARPIASASSPAALSANPAFGPDHGFDVTVPGLDDGPHSVCISGIDTTTSVRTNLACRTVTIAGGASPPPSSFSDVAPGGPFFESIAWMVDQGLSTGFTDGTYRPMATMTRQASAVFLYRLAGSPGFDPPAVPSFPDVGVTHPFRTEIEWLAATGIADGFDDGRFQPTAPVARQTIAVFLYRFAGSPSFTVPLHPAFTDVLDDHPFRTEIEWLAANGITDGNPDGTFGAGSPVTRQALAAFLARYSNPI